MDILRGDSYISNILTAITAFVAVFVSFYKFRFSYWKRKGIPSTGATIPFGKFGDLLFKRRSLGELLADLYREAKANGSRHIGTYFFVKPIYIPADVAIVKSVLFNDSDAFLNRGYYYNEKDDPLSAHLFIIDGPKWKKLRQKLTQTFTPGQIKNMFQTVVDTSVHLKEVLDEHANGKVMDVKKVLSCFTTDVIASCAFGISCNTLRDPAADFMKYGELAFDNSLLTFLRHTLPFAVPHGVLRAMRFRTTRKDVSEFFTSIIQDTVNYREVNNVYRKDFMHLLLQLKNRGKLVDDGKVVGPREGPVTLTFEELAAQAYVFYLAGYDTSSTATSFALFEIAKNQVIQDRLREEINEVLKSHGGEITYDSIMDMKYTLQVLEESLRKYPPVPFLERECSKQYRIPDTDLVLERGTRISIPVLGIHNDPEIYPDPETFDPERFNAENKRLLPSGAYIPFGDGPRNCIGLRFGILQSKVALVAILKDYKITINSKTPIPLVIEKDQLLHRANVWLNVERVR